MTERRDEILSLLLSLPRNERERALNDEAAGNSSLIAEIRSLLRLAETRSQELQLPDSEPPPRTIGHYPVLGELGRGGMGRVFLAQDPVLERTVAIKVLSAEIARREESLLRNEGKLLAAVNHPNLATIYSLETDGDSIFLTMELVEGSTLAERFREGLEVRSCLLILRQVSLALEAVHRRGIVHGDLSPANVCVRADGMVKVLDFGLSHLMTEQTDPEEPRGPVGTPGYMSPEQVRGSVASSRSDIFSLGCLLYEGLVGRPAFRFGSVAETLGATLDSEPGFDEGELPLEAQELILACLAKDPDARPRSISGIAERIGDLLSRSGRPSVRIRSRAERSNLPEYVTTFVGRIEERARIQDEIVRSRLVTLRGLGGVGKTRLAVECARGLEPQFSGGVWYLELASVHEIERLEVELARIAGIAERPGTSLRSRLVEEWSRSPTLVILDGCEHLASCCADWLGSLLPDSPGLHVLIASRQSLGLAGETLVPVAPLATGGAEGMSESIALFVDRAKAVRPDFALTKETRLGVQQICRRLDGLPLAIELAAARVRSLPVSGIAERLGDRFQLLSQRIPGLPERQRSLVLSMDHSHELLSAEERVVLRRLAIFPNGCSLEAAEAVCAGEDVPLWSVLDALDGLVDKSLLEAESNPAMGGVVYRYLGLVRQYAMGKLAESGETEICRRALADHLLQMTLRAREGERSSEQVALWKKLDAWSPTLDWFLSLEDHPELLEQRAMIGAALFRYWFVRGRARTGSRLFQKICAEVEKAGERIPTSVRAEVFAALGALHVTTMEYESVVPWCERAISLLDQDPAAETLAPKARSACLCNLGIARGELGQYDRAIEHWESALEIMKPGPDDANIGRTWSNLARVHEKRCDYERALEASEISLEIRIRIGDRFGEAITQHNNMAYLEKLGRVDEGIARGERSLAISRETGSIVGAARTLTALATIEEGFGEHRRASSRLLELSRLGEEIEDPLVLREACEIASRVLERAGRTLDARVALGLAFEHAKATGATWRGSGREAAEEGRRRLDQTLAPEGVLRAAEEARDVCDPIQWVAARLSAAEGSGSGPTSWQEAT